jgi:hypothetical protein
MRGKQTMKKDISKLQIKVINAVSKGYKSVEGPGADDFGMRVFCLEAMDSATAEQTYMEVDAAIEALKGIKKI